MLNMMKIDKIVYQPEQPADLLLENSKIKASCVNCKHKHCINYKMDEINSEQVEIPTNIISDVCPTNAIKFNEKVTIDQDKCIGCGLCASRCVNGSIFIKDGKALVNYENTAFKEEDFCNIKKEGNIVEINYNNIDAIYTSIIKNNIPSNVITRNLLKQIGVDVYLSRKGDVNQRMDGLLITDDKRGVLEVEFGNDVLSCPRSILDDLAVMCSRYEYDLEDTIALIVCLSLPNNRTDFWRVIKDIKKVLGIEIQTISIGVLLFCVWTNKKISLANGEFYCDVDEKTLRSKVDTLFDEDIDFLDEKWNVMDIKK